MDNVNPSYQVIFALDALVRMEARPQFQWSWVLINADGFVTVRGKVYETMRAAIDAAARYRLRHGGGDIRVNLKDPQHQDAPSAIYLS